MLEVAIMIEGQNGLNWGNWQRLATAVEQLGFAGLYRSDHYTNANPPDKDSLELWVSLTWLASHTSRIEFGPLVSPVSFRQPTMTARMAAAVDDLAGGRLHLGLGAGWQEREHNNFGWDLLEIAPRFDRFEEGLQIISHLLTSPEPLDFQGNYYRTQEAVLLPRPQRPGGPPIVIGGNGPLRTLPLVAKYAQEWNALFIPPPKFAGLSSQLDEMIVVNGREPAEVRRSLMTGLRFGQTPAELEKKLPPNRTVAELQALGMVVGTGAQVLDQLHQFAAAGVQRIMLQWLDLEDLDGLGALAEAVL
jgi:F420-dependent oxidoreductase-like protein